MNLAITKIVDEAYVEFSTDIGTGIGVLGGKLKTCDINVKYEVEFSIDKVAELGKIR